MSTACGYGDGVCRGDASASGAYEYACRNCSAKRPRCRLARPVSGTSVEPNHVYVGPPGGHLAIFNGTLHRMETGRNEARKPADRLLLPFAGRRSAGTGDLHCPVGYGHRRDARIEAIKGESGMAMVEQPQSAKYAGMPSSAIATGLADYVLLAGGDARTLVAYARGPYLKARPWRELPRFPPSRCRRSSCCCAAARATTSRLTRATRSAAASNAG